MQEVECLALLGRLLFGEPTLSAKTLKCHVGEDEEDEQTDGRQEQRIVQGHATKQRRYVAVGRIRGRPVSCASVVSIGETREALAVQTLAQAS